MKQACALLASASLWLSSPGVSFVFAQTHRGAVASRQAPGPVPVVEAVSPVSAVPEAVGVPAPLAPLSPHLRGRRAPGPDPVRPLSRLILAALRRVPGKEAASSPRGEAPVRRAAGLGPIVEKVRGLLGRLSSKVDEAPGGASSSEEASALSGRGFDGLGKEEEEALRAAASWTGEASSIRLPPAPPAGEARPLDYLDEDALGMRRVHGLRRVPGLKPLGPGADERAIALRISRQFGIGLGKVLDMGVRYRLEGRAAWLAVYDRLQKANREEFFHLDQKKHHDGLLGEALSRALALVFPGRKVSEASFRKIAGKPYSEGWKGLLERSLEVHKHAAGFFLRLPYHLFDSFVLGYFRRNAAFEFLHSAEDFFAVRDALDVRRIELEGGRPDEVPAAERWLEAIMTSHGHREATTVEKWKASSAWRWFGRWVLAPALEPLLQFAWRRLTMAVFSAAAMGLVSGALPMPILALRMSAVPLLGPALVGAAHGLPALLLGIPLVGEGASRVLGASLNALVSDLAVGSLLNTLVLSSALTFPSAMKQRFMDGRHGTLAPPTPLSRDWWRGLFGTLVSWTFWSQNLKSLFGMLSVGAEIEGVMGYAGAVDSALSPAFRAATGTNFKLFETLAAAVEKPAGESPIPFGGAVTWGNVLLYKAQAALGFNLTDAVYKAVHGTIYGLSNDPVAYAIAANADPGHSAAAQAAAPRGSLEGFKPGTPREMADRAAHDQSLAGDLSGELQAARERLMGLEARLGLHSSRLESLKAQSRPITAQERARYQELMEALSSGRDEAYIRSKMAEIRDLANGRPDENGRLEALRRLERFYDALILPPTEDPGRDGELDVRVAALKALEALLSESPDQEGATGGAAKRTADPETEKMIENLVEQSETLRAQAKAELANRNALERLLGAIDTSRNAALRQRRNGRDMLEFHKNLARLATVMDLAFSLNEIAAAEKAIADMQALLDRKLEKIDAVKNQSSASQQEAQRQQGKTAERKKEVDAAVAEDQKSASDMRELEEESGKAVTQIDGFRTEVRALIARIDAEDSGSSPNPPAEYDRRLALLPQMALWSKEGKPGDPDYLSLPRFEHSLSQVDDYTRKIDEGLGKIDSTPVEFAGVMVLAVPGVPDFNVTNPDQATTLRLLDERAAYWKQEAASYQKLLDDVRHRMDPNFSGSEVDDFGDSRPYSLVRWQAQEEEALAKSRSNAQGLLAEVDKYAAEINRAVPGASLPMLSGLSLKDLTDAVEKYPDRLTAVSFPDEDTPEIFNAKMALLGVGRVLPKAGREVLLWNKSDAIIARVQDVRSNTLPKVEAGLAGVVAILKGILDDVEADKAFVNAGGHDAAANQALIDRKRSLLTGLLRPNLQAAGTMVRNTLIPFVNDQIKGDDPDADGYGRLFKAQKTLYEAAKKCVDRTLPWALASNGAADGDSGGASAKTQAAKKKYQKYLDGYDDSSGHHKGISEWASEIERRKDPNYAGTEDVYGEAQPFSLPRKIDQYSSEKAQRAAQINAADADINSILARLDQMTGGGYGLSSYALPTGIDANSQSGVDRVQSLVDAGTMFKLGDLLTEIGNTYKAKAGSVDVGGTGEGTVRQGTQPPTTIDNDLQIALLALETAKRLAPSTNQTAPGGNASSASYAVARFLYSDSVVQAARKYLSERIPVAEAFLSQAKAGLSEAVADLDKDLQFTASNGSSESADAVVERKLAIYRKLNALTRAGAEFYAQKESWDKDSYGTVDSIDTYYGSTTKVYQASETVSSAERDAILRMKEALSKTLAELEKNRVKLNSWMSQLNNPNESALKRVAENISDIQDKTRAVLEQNVKFRDVEDQLKRSHDTLAWLLRRCGETQAKLNGAFSEGLDASSLSPALLARVNALRQSGGAWFMSPEKPGADSSIVVPKKDFSRFIDQLFSSVLKTQASGQDAGRMREQLLANPAGLSSIIPSAQVIDFGDADGFYIVYQTQFSIPHGMETSNWITFGNVGQVLGNNVSVSGYQFVSPPNDENAPYGDKGVEVQVESLQGSNWVNYLNIDLHRFIQDIPADTKMASSARQTRMLIFDDFAMLLFGDRLYIGAAGFADFALNRPSEKTQFYGGSLKTSLKFNEVMRLNAEQQAIFARDPRKFLQTVNLDFTGLDPDLDQTFVIDAKGENKSYRRTQVGPSFDVARLLGSEDAFTVDFYLARQTGTDDYTQNLGGVSVLKGFTLRDANGKPWMTISNKLTAEKGQKTNNLSDRVTVNLPDLGIALSAEGKIIGDAKTYYVEASKTAGAHSNVSLSYGSRYVGLNNRLTLSFNSSFTLGELWRAVSGGASDALEGSRTLKPFQKKLDDVLKDKDDATVAEIRRVFSNDIGRQMITQNVGELNRQIDDLRKAGAFFDNVRIQGMVGFVSNPVGTSTGDRAAGGGLTAGTMASAALTKTQKGLIEQKISSLLREGMRLQARFVELAKGWQELLVEITEAQWELKMASYQAEKAPTESLRAEGRVWEARARARLNAATIRYGLLTGRSSGEAPPFGELSFDELSAVLSDIRATLSSQGPLAEVLRGLDPKALKAELGPEPFNLMDWIPWIERLTLFFGTQIQDQMGNQILGTGASIRLPIYDPGSGERDHAYRLEARAIDSETRAEAEAFRLRAYAERRQAQDYLAAAESLRSRFGRSREDLYDALSGYRNGVFPLSRLREAFSAWRSESLGYLGAACRGNMAEAWAAFDDAFSGPPRNASPVALSSFQEAFDAAAANAPDLEQVGLRQEAAAEMARANDHRIQKLWVDLVLGTNLTSDGVGWIPTIGVTGIGVTPIPGFQLKPEELRELQVRQGEGQSRYYGAFKTRLEIDLAVEMFRGVCALSAAESALALLRGEIIPRAQRRLGEANARAASDGDPAGLVARARSELAGAQRKEAEAILAAGQAKAALNFMLGRSPDAPLEWSLPPAQALSQLRQILSRKGPVEADEAVLKTRVEVAQAVETMVDKGLKMEELRIEPVSLVVRSLGRLLNALSEESIGNPDAAAAARVQTLEAQRAREAYGKDRDAQVRRAQAELRQARKALGEARTKDDPDSRLRAVGLSQRAQLLEASLARLGASQEPGEGSEAAPASFAELSDRLAKAKEAAAAVSREPESAVFEPETRRHLSSMTYRLFRQREDVSRDPINENYLEGWVELRLHSLDTPPETLLALSRLRMEKADRMRRGDALAARAQAGVLLSRFEADVRLLRWSRAAGVSQGLAGPLQARISSQASEIKALLGLDPGLADSELERLVPADPAGASGGPADIAARITAQVRKESLRSFVDALFEGGPSRALGNEDDLDAQVRADVIASRMVYKGFTPVAVFGIFRGRGVGGAFLEAPDPRAIESSLESVLTDSLRKELKSRGRMQEMTLKLHLLMKGVADKTVLVEKLYALARASQEEFRAVCERSERGLDGPADIASAEQSLFKSWQDFLGATADLQADFTTLVTELEALGFDSKNILGVDPEPFQEPRQARRSAESRLLEYLSRRTLDEEFAGRLGDFFAAQAGASSAAAEISERAGLYRLMSEDAGILRRRPDIPAPERFQALVNADPEGRRLRVEDAIGRAWSSLDGASLAAFMAFVREEIRSDLGRAREERDRESALLDSMREAFAGAFEAPGKVKGAMVRLKELGSRVEAARRELVESYVREDYRPGAEAPGGNASRFIERDAALDGYLRAQSAYDEEVVGLFGSGEVRADADLARRLDSLYGFRESASRQEGLLAHGRGLLAVDAMIMVENSRIAALRWRQADPGEFEGPLANLDRLQRLKARWLSEDQSGLEPLGALVRVDSQGRRQWVVEQWKNKEEIDRLEKGDGVENGEGGRRFVKGDSGERLELLRGADLAAAGEAEKGRLASEAALRSRVYATLQAHDFALVPLAGGAVEGLSYEQVQDLMSAGGGKEGRLYTFSREPRHGGLHWAVNPLQALWTKPDSSVTVVYRGEKPPARGHFPTLESLEDFAKREGEGFARLEAGARGARRMADESREHRARWERAGWIGVKLQSYAFAVDKNGRVVSLYLTQDEFEESLGALRRAGDVLPRTLEIWAAARAKAAQAKEAFERQEASTESEVRSLPAAGDPRLAEARRRVSDKVAQSRKLERASGDAFLDAEKAYEAARDAAKIAAAAGIFDKVSGAYLAALKESGMTDGEVSQEEAALEAYGGFSLYLSRETALSIDGANRIVAVDAEPVFGGRRLERRIGRSEGPVRTVRGEVFAAVMDDDQSLSRLYMDQASVEAAAKGWTLKAVGGISGPSGAVNPNMRLMHYEESFPGRGGESVSLPVMLNRRYLISRVQGAGRSLSEAGNWAFMPWNWGNLLLEVPRGIAKTPLEIVDGRDPRQQGYLGRVMMRKIEGGATSDHGFFRKAAGMLDVLEIFPDRVDWFFDPSQFPQTVRLDSPLLPGEDLSEKGMSSGSKNVHFGVQALRRARSYNVEDLLNARRRVLSYFDGGVEESWVERLRGRDGDYLKSAIEERHGADQLETALSDPEVALAPGSDGLGEVVQSGEPGHLEVESVERRLRLRTGAEQYRKIEKGLSDLSIREPSPGEAEKYRAERARYRAELKDALAARSGAESRSRGISEEARALGWRIGEQESLEGEIREAEAEIVRLKEEIARERENLARLEASARREAPVGRLPWALLAGALALAASAAFLFLRRKRPTLGGQGPGLGSKLKYFVGRIKDVFN